MTTRGCKPGLKKNSKSETKDSMQKNTQNAPKMQKNYIWDYDKKYQFFENFKLSKNAKKFVKMTKKKKLGKSQCAIEAKKNTPNIFKKQGAILENLKKCKNAGKCETPPPTLTNP